MHEALAAGPPPAPEPPPGADEAPDKKKDTRKRKKEEREHKARFMAEAYAVKPEHVKPGNKPVMDMFAEVARNAANTTKTNEEKKVAATNREYKINEFAQSDRVTKLAITFCSQFGRILNLSDKTKVARTCAELVMEYGTEEDALIMDKMVGPLSL